MKIKRTKSSDGTGKYAFDLEQGLQMEAAFFKVPGRERPNIACVSTQLGCAVGCVFCTAAKTEFFRNLTTEEMLFEVSTIVADHLGDQIFEDGFEVSFMGLGEPLANLRNVVATIKHIGLRYPEITRVSISTAGPARRIDALIEQMPIFPPVHLQISLHATKDDIRRILVPYAPESIANLLEAGRRFHKKTGDQVFLNYVLLRGTNDSDEDASWLAGLDKEAFLIKISALNQVPGLPPNVVPASPEEIHRFSILLTTKGVQHKVFVGDGLDVHASCGQLAARPIEVILMNSLQER
jgi:23S rRNA (adenine2503-C2)-methyltransferase